MGSFSAKNQPAKAASTRAGIIVLVKLTIHHSPLRYSWHESCLYLGESLDISLGLGQAHRFKSPEQHII